MTTVSLIIPAYNEVARIGETVRAALDYFDGKGVAIQIIVAADGTDGTREAARALAKQRPGIEVIGGPERRGKGCGVRDGVRISTGDVIGFIDADNKTPISEYDKVEPLFRQGYDMVIGSRALHESRIERAQPLYRQLGSRGFGVFLRAFVRLTAIVDTQCGFKFFRGDVARELFRLQKIDGYMFDVEILYLAQQLGYRIAEVPVRWRDDRDSRLQLVSGNIRNLRDIASIRWRHRTVVAIAPAEAAERQSSPS